jgi:hypothetical protein
MDDSFGSKVLLEAIKTVFSLILLVIGWLGGQSIIEYWDYRKKRNEIDIASAQRFFELYGEFKAIIRLWRVMHYNTHPPGGLVGMNSIPIPQPEVTRWELLKRAAAAESGVESLILKLTAERMLKENEMRTLGLFRQAYQRLRESIREDRLLHWTYQSKEYVLFNNLAMGFARMISVDKAPRLEMIRFDESPEHPTPEKARQHLQIVTSYRSEHFEQRLDKVKSAEKHKGTDADDDDD